MDEHSPLLQSCRQPHIRLFTSINLTGKYTRDTEFPEDDHRNYNRDGAAFDAGATFSGVDFATGVKAAQEFSVQWPDGVTTAQAALA
ncbi:UNVERIFIED_ORG: hypothetical protein ABIB52_004185 [Arthrobacter sp. UYCu721]